LLKQELLRVCAEHPQLLVLDLSELTHINSVVLGAMLLCMRLMSSSGGQLRLAAVRPNILEVLDHSRLLPLFDCRPTVEAALSDA
jgi:anti-anti-sigma factor